LFQACVKSFVYPRIEGCHEGRNIGFRIDIDTWDLIVLPLEKKAVDVGGYTP